MVKTLISFFRLAAYMFVGLLLIVYAWMFLFINYLHYDYVMASSVLFMISFAYRIPKSVLSYLATGSKEVRSINKSKRTKRIVLLGFLVYPFVLSSTLQVYENWSTPVYSDAINMVAIYRGLLDVPIAVGQSFIISLGPFYEKITLWFEAHPIVRQLIIVLFITPLFNLFSKSFNAIVEEMEQEDEEQMS